MYRMATSFNLRDGVSIEDFVRTLEAFANEFLERDLLLAVSSVAERHRHAVMDTASDDAHEYFFIMDFRDLAQCDAAVEKMYAVGARDHGSHAAMLDAIEDPVFTCWQDLD